MPAVILDSFALLAYLRQESGWQTVRNALHKAAEGECDVAMTEVNYAEVQYIILKKDGAKKWTDVQALLAVLPITFYPVDRTLADLAASFKARFKMSLADACAAALAKKLSAPLYTNDPEFKALKPDISLVNI